MTRPAQIDSRLWRQFSAGDRGATRLVFRQLVAAAPKAKAREFRDAIIVDAANAVLEAAPGSTLRRVALVMTEAGRSLQSDRELSGRAPFDELPRPALAELNDDVRDALSCGVGWPALRQMISILSGVQ